MNLVLKCGNLIDGVMDDPLGPATLVIEDNRIKSIEESESKIEGDHALIDLSDCTVLPGLMDCHVHLISDGNPSRETVPQTGPSLAQSQLLRAIHNMKKSLEGGVTTVRDLGAPNEVILFLRDMKRSGNLVGPRIIASGANITTTGGHGWAHGIEADTASEVRKAARAQLKLGVDVLKIMSSGGVFTALSRSSNCQYSVEELREAVVEAEKMGKRVATHSHSKEAIKSSILAGIHSIEHGIFLDDECIELMLERGTYLVPTLAPHTYIWGNPEINRIPKVFLDKAMLIREPNFRGARKAIEAGVKIAAGTDSGIPFMEHGRVVSEVETLRHLGMKPMEAIKAATRYASGLLQVDHVVGTLEPGKLADLIAVRGNPISDLTTLRHPVLVIQDGKVVAVDPEVKAPYTRETLLLTRRGGWPTWVWQDTPASAC